MIGFPKKIATKQDYYNMKKMVMDGILKEIDFQNYLRSLLEDEKIDIPILEKYDKYIYVPHNPELTLEDAAGSLNIEHIQLEDGIDGNYITKITFSKLYKPDVLRIPNKNSELHRLGIDISEIMEVYNG
ncbi:MAG: hypothetical protein ACRCYT_00690 [Cetobacterium sp.]|uniref:hypothetical protein n=1 Tax=Cetobacterium sp. TaxID=2071632 RepID=UPI003F3A24F7